MPNSIVVDISLEELHESLELAKVLDHVLNTVCDELGFAFTTISLVDEDRQETKNVAGRNVVEGWIKDAHHGLKSDDIQAYILRTGNTVSIGEKEVEKETSINGKTVPLVGDNFCFDRECFTLDWDMYKKYDHHKLVRVWAPLGQQLPDGPIGTIEAGFYREEHQTILPILVNMLENYAAEATVAIQRAQLHEQVQRHVRMLTELHDVSWHLQTQSQKEDNEPRLLEQIAETALRILEADIVTLYPLEQSSLDDQAEPCFTEPISDLKGSGEIALPSSPGNLVKTIAENRKGDYRPDPQDARDPVGYSNDSVCSFAAVPLQSGGELLGVLCIGYRIRHQFSEYARQIIELFAQQAAVVIKLERSQRALRRQKEYFEGLVLHSPVAIAALDLAGIVESWNPAAEELFGYKEAEAVGSSIYDLVTKTPEMQEEASYIHGELHQGSQAHYRTRRSRKDRTLVDVDLLVTPAMVGGERVGSFAMYHDISELEAANQAKSNFVRDMSHELGNRVDSIIEPIKNLYEKAEEDGNKDLVRDLHEIKNAGEKVTRLIDRLLNHSDVERGKISLDLNTFDVATMVEDAVADSQPLAHNKGIGLRIAYPIPVREMRADQVRVSQALDNLLSGGLLI